MDVLQTEHGHSEDRARMFRGHSTDILQLTAGSSRESATELLGICQICVSYLWRVPYVNNTALHDQLLTFAFLLKMRPEQSKMCMKLKLHYCASCVSVVSVIASKTENRHWWEYLKHTISLCGADGQAERKSTDDKPKLWCITSQNLKSFFAGKTFTQNYTQQKPCSKSGYIENLENSLTLPNFLSLWNVSLIWGVWWQFTNTTYSATSTARITLCSLDFLCNVICWTKWSRLMTVVPILHPVLPPWFEQKHFLRVVMEICTTSDRLFEDSFK